MFLNLSNHSSDSWGETQKKAAEQYGEIIDMKLPLISPSATAEEVKSLAHDMALRVSLYNPKCVMCQGESTYVYALVNELKKMEIKTIAACSERIVKNETKDGITIKTAVFKFRGFREYL